MNAQGQDLKELLLQTDEEFRSLARPCRTVSRRVPVVAIAGEPADEPQGRVSQTCRGMPEDGKIHT